MWNYNKICEKYIHITLYALPEYVTHIDSDLPYCKRVVNCFQIIVGFNNWIERFRVGVLKGTKKVWLMISLFAI